MVMVEMEMEMEMEVEIGSETMAAVDGFFLFVSPFLVTRSLFI